VGGYFGGKVALKYAGSSEHQVVFIARGAYLAALVKVARFPYETKSSMQLDCEKGGADGG
jgi:hypothetical protein